MTKVTTKKSHIGHMIHNQRYHFVGISQEKKSDISNFRESGGRFWLDYERLLALSLFIIVLPVLFKS